MIDAYVSETKIRMEMVCDCGNIAKDVEHSTVNGAILYYKEAVFICNQCGKEMKRRITKMENIVKETEVN